MLKIKVVLSENYNEESKTFIQEAVDIELEHSLLSLSKWESKYEIPFIDKEEKTTEQVLSYVEAMILTPDLPPNIIEYFSEDNLEAVRQYIDAKMTASWIVEPPNSKPSTEKITSELIYYWMVSCQIPWEAENWHLNRLFTLIKIFGAKNAPPEKRNPKEAAQQRQALNEQRRRQYNSSG